MDSFYPKRMVIFLFDANSKRNWFHVDILFVTFVHMITDETGVHGLFDPCGF